MRSLLLFIILAFNCICIQDLFAQAYKPHGLKNGIISGDIKALDNVKEVNIFYDYSQMVIGDKVLGEGNYVKEEEFLEKKTKALDEKEGAGKGQEYREKWTGWIASRNGEEFAKLFNKWAKEINMSGLNNGVLYDYTLTIKAAGVFVGYPYSMDAFFIFTDKNGKELVTIFLRDLAGSPKELFHAYGKAAKEISDFIKINRKKAE